MEQARLLEVRCPSNIYNKTTGKTIRCNKLCVKVYPGSSGEIQCRHCKTRFNFYVDSQARSVLSVKAKTIPTETSNEQSNS